MTMLLVGVGIGLILGASLAVLIAAIFVSGAREDRVRGEYLRFDDLGRNRIGLRQ